MGRWSGTVSALSAMAVFLLVLPGYSQAPQDISVSPSSPLDGLVIRQIAITGLDRIEEAYIRNQIRSRENQPYSQDEVTRDVARLLRTGRFVDVRAEPVLTADNQVDLTLSIREKPAVRAIEFVGAEEFKPKDLLEELSFAVDDPLDLFEVRQGREAIERKYEEKGYAYVEVTYDEELLRSEQRVVYSIIENQRVRIREIAFEGNEAYSDGDLRDVIETKAYMWIFRTGDFDPDRAERDSAAVQKFYRDRGYLDAEVSYVPEFTDAAREKMRVVFRVNEGTRYSVQAIRIEGNTVLDTELLLTDMVLAEGDPLLDARLQAGVEAIETRYGEQGYIYATATPSTVFAEEPAQVIVTVTVREGEQFNVGWIEVNGNFHTQEKCVRRELEFYPEEIYNTTKTKQAEKELRATSLFTDAKIEPVGTEPGVRDVLVTVEENPNTNQFIAGIGASSDSGIVGNIVLENRNFDLFDKPRTWGEFFKGRAFRGAGQTMRLQLEPGTEFTRFRIDFREPYLMDKPIGFGTSLYLFERGRDGYDEQRIGGNVSFDKRFKEGWLKGWTGEIALRLEDVGVKDVDSFAAKAIQEEEGQNFLSTVKLTMLHDTTDDRFLPSEGHRFTAAWEQAGVLGGEYFFSQVTSSYAKHWTVHTDEDDRKSVISVRARVGQILGDAPVFERFYAGGIGSFRGFDYRGITPRDGLRKNGVGGDFMLLTGAEYSFPLYAKTVRGVFFTDMGTVEENFGISSWRASVGAGVRLTLDIFGTIPMEFDIAVPVSSEEDDDERVFSFFIGLPFF